MTYQVDGHEVRELGNFSVHGCDTEHYGNDWGNIDAFRRSIGLDGIELLLGYDPLPPVPPGMVTAVHLPFCVDWMSPYHGQVDLPGDISRLEVNYLHYGRDREDVLGVMGTFMERAATLSPAYAVLHASSVDLGDVFTWDHRHTDRQVLGTLAEALNTVASRFTGNEPPVRLAFENLWWPGLTFDDPGTISWFTDRLEFEDWGFLLDTGHLMNRLGGCREEGEAIDRLIDALLRLPGDVLEAMGGMHLHHSLSADHVERTRKEGDPEGYPLLPIRERMGAAIDHFNAIDEHRPFTRPGCREVLDLVRPDFVTHEFPSFGPDEYAGKVNVQRGAVHGTPTVQGRGHSSAGRP